MVLRAPFAGVVVERHAQVGETLAPGSVAFVLSDPLSVEVEARLSAEQVQSLRGARAVSFRWASGVTDLKLLRFSEVATLPSRTQVVRLGVGAGPRPASGVTGQLRWKGEQPVVPSGLIVRRPQGLGIFVLIPAPQGYSARFVLLPAAEEGRPVLLERSAAVQDASLVVVSGQNSLQDGQRVETARVRVPSLREPRP
jgi:multidrug efflux pump subunit AcrA (membrane-fusion protein)